MKVWWLLSGLFWLKSLFALGMIKPQMIYGQMDLLLTLRKHTVWWKSTACFAERRLVDKIVEKPMLTIFKHQKQTNCFDKSIQLGGWYNLFYPQNIDKCGLSKFLRDD